MNSFTTSEIKSFEKKLGSYQYLLTFRYSNLCVKADPISLLPVSITVGNREQNIEDVAQVVQMDDFHIVVVPKQMDVLRDVQEGIFEAHPEFKMSIEQMEKNDPSSRFILCEMPPVDKPRYDLLTEATKNLYEECKARTTSWSYATRNLRRSKKPTRNTSKTMPRRMLIRVSSLISTSPRACTWAKKSKQKAA